MQKQFTNLLMKRVLTPRVIFIIVLCYSKLIFEIEVTLILFTFLQRSFGSEKNDTLCVNFYESYRIIVV